jgi:hypothetical protein
MRSLAQRACRAQNENEQRPSGLLPTARRSPDRNAYAKEQSLDILAHALYSTAGGIAARRKLHWRIHLGWLAACSVLPDLVVFGIPAAVRIGRFLTGASRILLPDGSGPRFDWAFGIYDVTHSGVVWALCFGAVWLLARRPVLELIGWALHIAIDTFTHTGIFAIKLLWPLSPVHFDGIRWETPWFLALTYLVLAAVFLVLWISPGNAIPSPISAWRREDSGYLAPAGTRRRSSSKKFSRNIT